LACDKGTLRRENNICEEKYRKNKERGKTETRHVDDVKGTYVFEARRTPL